MNLWTVIGLSISAILVGIGIAVGQGASPAFGSLLIVIGGSCAAVVLAIWAALAMGFGRRQDDNLRATSSRIDTLMNELTAHARLATDKGILLIADARVSSRQYLFAEGANRLIRAESSATIREALASLADQEASREFARRQRLITACRFVPVTTLALAFACAIWMLLTVARQEAQQFSATALALLCAVYGVFAISALAVEAADRLQARTAEDELAASLIIESIVALRQGETPDMISARLRGMIPPPAVLLEEASPLRRAA